MARESDAAAHAETKELMSNTGLNRRIAGANPLLLRSASCLSRRGTQSLASTSSPELPPALGPRLTWLCSPNRHGTCHFRMVIRGTGTENTGAARRNLSMSTNLSAANESNTQPTSSGEPAGSVGDTLAQAVRVAGSACHSSSPTSQQWNGYPASEHKPRTVKTQEAQVKLDSPHR